MGKFVLRQSIYFFHIRTFDDEQPFPHFKSFPTAKESAELGLLYIQILNLYLYYIYLYIILTFYLDLYSDFKSFPAAKESAELSLLYIQRPIFELLTADKDEIKNNFDFVKQLFYSWNIKYSKDEAL